MGGLADKANRSVPDKEAAQKGMDSVIADRQGAMKAYHVPSAHAYGDPAADVNRFAHVFTADYIDPKTGEKSLVITETQSDWAREGRSKGYKE